MHIKEHFRQLHTIEGWCGRAASELGFTGRG